MAFKIAILALMILMPTASRSQTVRKQWKYAANYEKQFAKYSCKKTTPEEGQPPRLQLESNKSVQADTSLRNAIAELWGYYQLEAIESPAMFAGHYLVADETKSPSSQVFYLIDIFDGKIYDGFTSANGWKLDIASRVALIDPPGEDGMYSDGCAKCSPPKAYLWNEKAKKFEALELESAGE